MLKNYPMMFCFVGEQPVANLIPIKYLNPKDIVFCVTERTEEKGNSLKSAAMGKGTIKKTEPYNIDRIFEDLTALIDDLGKRKNETEANKIVFNLTGGTKPMVFAGLLITQKHKLPFCYLQSEGGKSVLYSYRWGKNKIELMERKELPVSINLDEYLKVHVGEKYSLRQTPEKYEELVYRCLHGQVDEIVKNICLAGSLEVDLIFRVGNRVGIAEIKTKNKARTKDGIDHLHTAGAREYLGTYTKKFYIVDREYPSNNKDLAKERNIIVIELTDSENTDSLKELDKRDRKILVNTILTEMQR